MFQIIPTAEAFPLLALAIYSSSFSNIIECHSALTVLDFEVILEVRRDELLHSAEKKTPYIYPQNPIYPCMNEVHVPYLIDWMPQRLLISETSLVWRLFEGGVYFVRQIGIGKYHNVYLLWGSPTASQPLLSYPRKCIQVISMVRGQLSHRLTWQFFI